jgi:hypothetical protein
MNEKIKGILTRNGGIMQQAWNELVQALAEQTDDDTAQAVLYLNGVGYRAGNTSVGIVVGSGLLGAGWSRSTDGMTVCTSPVSPEASLALETFNPVLREFRAKAVGQLFDRFLSVKLAAGAAGERLRLEARDGFAPWQIAGALPDGDAVRAAYFDPETLAAREALVVEDDDMPPLVEGVK